MDAREFTMAMEELISSPGQNLTGDIINGYKYKGDKIMFAYEKEVEWLREYMAAVARVNGVSVESTYDPVLKHLHVKFYDNSKPSYANTVDIYLDEVPNIYEVAISVSLSVSRKAIPIINNVYSRYSIPKMKIEKVIFNDPATIVLWADGTKTVVKAVDEGFDPEKGLAMAITKKALGNEGNYYNTIRKYIDEYQAKEVECLYPHFNLNIDPEKVVETMDEFKRQINKKFGVPGTLLRGEDNEPRVVAAPRDSDE